MTRLQGVFSENLKNARKSAGLTQEALADRLGTAAKYLGAIERGVKFPSVQMIEALAGALGIAPYELFIEPSAATGSSPTEIINTYNRFLEDKLAGDLRQAGKDFLGRSEGKSE